MCGIAGIWARAAVQAEDLDSLVGAMTDAIAYRGPDGEGHWIDRPAGIALGHRRLAIIDLSATGHQPMASRDGRIVLVYNGELYNTREIARELGVQLRGTSDTEVLAEAIAKFGIHGALERANGLFAFAAFDRSTSTLHLARDRLGIKPLYWTEQRGVFAFASELKALRAAKSLSYTIDLEALSSYLLHGCVPAPRSIYREVAKLLPGRRLEITGDLVQEHSYWSLADIAVAGQGNIDPRAENAVVEELDALLSDAVKRQMISDVPLGAFLSGGVDSSLVVALMRKATNGTVRTFSIGFTESAYNEADDARAVARHIGTEHTEVTLSPEEARTIIPDLPAIYDEPFSDSSQIPTHLVSRIARQHVTVALSGDGGDEAFGGYFRYRAIGRLWNLVRHLKLPARQRAGRVLRLLSPSAWDALAQPIPRRMKPSRIGDKIFKASYVIEAQSQAEMYRRVMAHWPDPARLMRGINGAGDGLDAILAASKLDSMSRLRLVEMLGYLPDDLLTKVDRASMAVSLEVRVPLLDHRVVEFAWRLPSHMLMRNGKGKRPLRKVLDRYVPRSLVDRPKMGFSVPIGEWIRGPLRGWAEDLLSSRSLAEHGLFDAQLVSRRLAEHCSGRRDWQHALWALLQFEAWRRAST